jgi:hypothetical protein
MIAPRSAALVAIGTVILFTPTIATAQQVDPADATAIALELRRLLDGQQRIIEEQSRRIGELQRQVDALRAVAAALYRQLRGFPSITPSDIVGADGWGVNASGRPGIRVNKDAHRGGVVQMQIGSTFRF